MEGIEAAGAVMTGEICGCFNTKKEGVLYIKRIKEKYGLKTVVSAGIGDFIVKEAADSLNMGFVSLSTIYGKGISAVFPAYAVAKLLERSF